MKILFAGSELTPIAKVGGLGDVMEALPRALEKLGVDVSIVIPRYGFIKKENLKPVAASIIEVPLAGTIEKVSLFKTTLPNSHIPVYLVENEDYWTHAPEPYFEQTAFAGAEQEIQRFIFFSKAVCALIKAGHLKADIVHANDWHTGALVSLLKRNFQFSSANWRTNFQTPKVIFTIHNLGNQGKWDAKEIDDWFFAKNEKKIFQTFSGEHNFIAEGIINADWITAVSPTYAQEILTKKYGNGLDSLLRTRKKELSGILNGIDYEFFNPATDKFLYQCFTANTLSARIQNKISLGKDIGLPMDKKTPLFGLVSRLTEQKGIDFITGIVPMFVGKHSARFIFLGKGTAENEKVLIGLQKRFKDSIYVKIGFDEILAHHIYAASDFFLMPSRFEPSGLGQMIAMRYGSVPIVRETGGLKDSVQDMKTGIVFRNVTANSFKSALEKAWKMFAVKHDTFVRIQLNGMRENFDFSSSAEKYIQLYKRILKEWQEH